MATSTRWVQDPMMTDAEFIHQRATKPGNPRVGKIQVKENAATRIGGLALIRKRLEHHERAAEWFKTMYEARYGSGAGALDYAKDVVDTSLVGHDGEIVHRMDGSAELREAMDHLGTASSDRIVASIVLGIPCQDQVQCDPGRKPSGRATDNAVRLLLNDLDKLAMWKGFAINLRAS